MQNSCSIDRPPSTLPNDYARHTVVACHCRDTPPFSRSRDVYSMHFIEQEIARAAAAAAADKRGLLPRLKAEGGPANICLRGEKTANPANYSRGSRREETARTLFLREPPARISSDLSSSLRSSDRDTKRSVTLLCVLHTRQAR